MQQLETAGQQSFFDTHRYIRNLRMLLLDQLPQSVLQSKMRHVSQAIQLHGERVNGKSDATKF